MKRRDLLTGALGAAAVFPVKRLVAAPRYRSGKKILVLGGTNFVGPAVVQAALARGHDVTLFNRGITRPHLFPELEKLRGTRSLSGSDLRRLETKGPWDAVIDVWPEQSRLVAETTSLLRDRVDYYFYISSIAVYSDFTSPGQDETAPVRDDPPDSYGAEKAAAEAVVRTTFAGRHGIVRCPSIIGPFDPGAAYHFWVRRLALRDEVLCPGSGADPVQVLDVRDLAAWIVDSVELARVGTHNLTGPWPPLTLRHLLTDTAAGLASTAELTWVDANFLRREHGLQSFVDLPLWAPLDEDEGFYQIDGRIAIQGGAIYRPIRETALASWQWFQSYFFKDISFPFQGLGISAPREHELLNAWSLFPRQDAP